MEKEKIKILGISKRKNRSEYIFPKEQKLFGIIREILYELDFEDGPNDDVESIGRPRDKWEHVERDKENNIFDKEYNEKIINLESKKYSVDIIFFSKKVVLIFHYKKDLQQEIAKVINKFIEDEE